MFGSLRWLSFLEMVGLCLWLCWPYLLSESKPQCEWALRLNRLLLLVEDLTEGHLSWDWLWFSSCPSGNFHSRKSLNGPFQVVTYSCCCLVLNVQCLPRSSPAGTVDTFQRAYSFPSVTGWIVFPKLCYVLTPGTSEGDLIWKRGYYRCNLQTKS